MQKPTISLVIPMFNEEANIEHAIGYAVEALTQHSRDYEIIIVDDASTDLSRACPARDVRESPYPTDMSRLQPETGRLAQDGVRRREE